MVPWPAAGQEGQEEGQEETLISNSEPIVALVAASTKLYSTRNQTLMFHTGGEHLTVGDHVYRIFASFKAWRSQAPIHLNEIKAVYIVTGLIL